MYHRASDDEAARGVKVVNRLIIQQVGGNHGLDDFLEQVAAKNLVGDVLVVLSADDNSVHTLGHSGSTIKNVFDCDLEERYKTTEDHAHFYLGLAVRAQIAHGAVAAKLGHLLADLV